MTSFGYIISVFCLCKLISLDAISVGPGPAGRKCPKLERGLCFKGMPKNDTLRPMYLLDHCLTTFCDTHSDGGGWLVIQRRVYKENWTTKTWNEFKVGFGTLCTDFWLGNEFIFRLTSSGTWELRIDVVNNGKPYYAVFDNFKVLSEAHGYGLVLGMYSGDAGNEFSQHNYAKFSTIDSDNDNSVDFCAKIFESGWWFNDCFHDNLNGNFDATVWGRGVYWQPLNPDLESQLTSTEMKMRLKAK